MKKILTAAAIAASSIGAFAVAPASAGSPQEVLMSVNYHSFAITAPARGGKPGGVKVTIDVASYELGFDGDAPFLVDLNNDEEIAYLDTFIHVFRDDGELTADDYIASNDDDNDFLGTADGTVSPLDSYLSLLLQPGNYLVAISGFSFSVAEAVAGENVGEGPLTADADGNEFANDHGDYRISITEPASRSVLVAGEGTIFVIPAPGAIALFGAAGLLASRRRR